MFEDSTFESNGRIHTHSRGWMAATFLFNGSILLAMILIPLIYPAALPPQMIPFLVQAPVMPPAPEPVKPQPVHASQGSTNMDSLGHIVVPNAIPKFIVTPDIREDPVTFTATNMGQDSFGPGGSGPILPGRSAAPIVRPETMGPVHLPSSLVAGFIVTKTIPVYPPIARAAGVEGTVTLQATISKTGTIENLRVLGGHPMLQQAALDAVRKWCYRPYQLNGQPVEVETTVNVIFALGR